MSTGFLALLDDVAAIAKVAAASLDDVAAQAVKSGAKAAGVVIDDAAVTPRYLLGFAAERELPIVRRIAVGSLRNKLLFLMPGALALSLLAPWAITPLLTLGGLFLCFEGAEKVAGILHPHGPDAAEATPAPDPLTLENTRVAGAVQTDFILSAEIMAITLAAIDPGQPFWVRLLVLAGVGIGITVLVYGAVALIVKADDLGISLAARRPSGVLHKFGRFLVVAMPVLLQVLSVVGTAAMLWVGGGIVLHGLEEFGWGVPAHAVHDAATAAGAMLPAGGILEWLVGAVLAGLFGLMLGVALIPVVTRLLVPAWQGVAHRRN